MKKVFSNLFNVMMVLLVVWVVMSWLNISFNNTTINPVYADWNLFIMLLK